MIKCQVIICQIYFLSQHHGNAWYTMTKWTTLTIQQSSAVVEPHTVVKTTVHYVQHSVEPLPSVCHATGWSLDLVSQHVRTVLVMVRIKNWNAINTMLQLQNPPYRVANRVKVRAVGPYRPVLGVFKYYLYLNIKSAKSIWVKYLNTLYKLSILNTI